MKVLQILTTSSVYDYSGWQSQQLRVYGDDSSLMTKTIKNYEDSLKAGNHCSAMHFIITHIDENTREVSILMNEVKKIPLKKRIEINKPPEKTAKKKNQAMEMFDELMMEVPQGTVIGQFLAENPTTLPVFNPNN